MEVLRGTLLPRYPGEPSMLMALIFLAVVGLPGLTTHYAFASDFDGMSNNRSKGRDAR